MTTPPDLGLAHSTAELSFGASLEQARKLLGLSLQDVSTRLLLSVNQIRGLEAENQQAFYNDWFYVQAAKKYSGFLNIALPESLINAAEHPALSRMSPVTQGSKTLAGHPTVKIDLGRFSHQRSASQRTASIVFFSLVLFGFAVGIGVFAYLNLFSDVPPVQTAVIEIPAATVPPPVVAPTPETPPAPEIITPPAPLMTQLTLSFTAACWIQAINTDGTRVEKIFNNGEKLELDLLKLSKLVVGNVAAISMTAGVKDVPIGTFVNRGSTVARLTGAELTTQIDRLN
jgi:cytoskeletal protein RodZ